MMKVHKWQVSFLPLLQSSVVTLIPYITVTFYIDFLIKNRMELTEHILTKSRMIVGQGKVRTVI